MPLPIMWRGFERLIEVLGQRYRSHDNVYNGGADCPTLEFRPLAYLVGFLLGTV